MCLKYGDLLFALSYQAKCRQISVVTEIKLNVNAAKHFSLNWFSEKENEKENEDGFIYK